MFNSNKSMYCLLALAILILVVCSNSANAVCLNESNQTDSFESNHDTYKTNDAAVKIDTSEKSDENTVKKNYNKDKKENYELRDISLSVEDIECDYGDVVDVNVLTIPEVDEGILSFYVNERLVGAKNLSDSAASYALSTSSYMPGTYDLLVSYSASLNYANNHTTSKLKINRVESEIKNIEMKFDSDNTIHVKLNVEGKNNERLDFGFLNVYDDTALVESVEIEDYDVEFTLDKKYNEEILTFEFVGDEYYSDAVINYLVYVKKSNINIYLPYLSAYQSTTINQSLTFYTDTKVNDGKINVYINGVFVNQINVESENVDILIDTSNYVSGNYLVYIEYVDSDVYSSTSYQTTLNIKQIATTLYTYNITAHKNQIINLRAYIYNYIDETNQGIVEFLIDDESIKTVILNNNSILENYIVPDNLDYGRHSLKIIYHGTSKYHDSQADAILNIIKYSNSLTLKNYTLNDDGNIVINIKSYSYNNTVNDGEMDVYVNNKLVSNFNVTDNITSVTLPEDYSANNEYEIKVLYRNSEKYDDANLTAIITPEKYDTTTKISKYVNKENILNITSYIYSTRYSDINEGIVNFYINDTMIGRADVKNSCANLLYSMEDMEEKNYTIKTEYIGTRLYANSENSTKIDFKISRNTLYITTDSSIKTTPGKTIIIRAELTDYEGNIINITGNATVKILNETIKKEFTDGIIHHEHFIDKNCEEQISNITIEVPETKHYKNTTRTLKLTIAKNSPYITTSNIIRSNKYETVKINASLILDRDVVNENITGVVKINNKTVYQGKFINGLLEYKLVLNNKYRDDFYNITIKSQETPYYHSAEKTIQLLLNTRNTYIISQNIVSKNGEKIIIEANIHDQITKDPVKGTSKACIKINEVTLENLNVTDGRLIYSYINDYSAKNYSITIIYGENGIYNSSRWEGTLTIEASPLKIVTNNINAPAYSTINIKARVLDSNKLAEGIIKTAIKINNKTIIEDNITGGIIDFNYRLPDEIGSGKYSLTIIVGDSRKYIHDISTVDLIVKRNYKHIQTNNITARKDDMIKIKADILDTENHLINKTTKVNIKLGGRSITDMNISNGKIEYDYRLPENLKSGLYDLLIQAGETGGYYHATTNSVLKVE